MDRAKVIKGFEVCSDVFGNCYDCPYTANGEDPERCDRQAFKDALTLLKEPETVKCGVFYREDYEDEWYAHPNHCVSCERTWMGSTNYCPNCGLKLKEVNILEGKDESGRCD